MKRILITGANKGIGLATVNALLEQRDDTHVLLGARDAGRGRAALEALTSARPDWASRLELLQIDVTDANSVNTARRNVEEKYGTEPPPLYAIVNNAGIGLTSPDTYAVVNTNIVGVKRVCDAFIPLLQSDGRVVNVSSASGPRFLETCSARMQAFFQDRSRDWIELEELIEDTLYQGDNEEALRAAGLGEFTPYGFSKACVSLYTMMLAEKHPQLNINACTPGYIETDLTRPAAEARRMSPLELGMKSPAEGAVPIMHLLFAQLEGNGNYYGSDAKRSPLNRYRAPGSPEYRGD